MCPPEKYEQWVDVNVNKQSTLNQSNISEHLTYSGTEEENWDRNHSNQCKMERLLELHRKMRSKLCKEIFGHSMAVIVFSGLVIVSIVEILKSRELDTRKLLAAVLGISHFGLCATAILHLKYCGIMEMNPFKCKIWIYLEVYNISATTAFIVIATRHLLPPPFHQWTGTSLLLIIYWLPLIMYKTSQVCRVLEFINILSYLKEKYSIKSVRKHCYDESAEDNVITRTVPCATRTCTAKNVKFATRSNHTPFTNPQAASEAAVVPPIVPMGKLLSTSTPHIPYEWALIDSISNAMP